MRPHSSQNVAAPILEKSSSRAAATTTAFLGLYCCMFQPFLLPFRIQEVLLLQFGIRLAAIRCPRLYGSRQYHRRETFQQNLASVHKKSVSEAATATDVFSRSYCCSLGPFLQRYGALGLTGLDNTMGAKRSKTNWRLFTRSQFLKPPPQQTCSAGLTVAVWNHSCSDTVPQALRV